MRSKLWRMVHDGTEVVVLESVGHIGDARGDDTQVLVPYREYRELTREAAWWRAIDERARTIEKDMWEVVDG